LVTILTDTAWMNTLGLWSLPILVGGYHSGLALLSLGVRESRFKLLGLVSPRIQDNPQTVTLETVFAHCGSAIIEDGQRSGTVS